MPIQSLNQSLKMLDLNNGDTPSSQQRKALLNLLNANSPGALPSSLFGYQPTYGSIASGIRTDVTVVSSAYDTSGSGRKLVRLKNGVLVAILKNSTSYFFTYSIDNGGIWSTPKEMNCGSLQDASIVAVGNMVYSIAGYNGSTVEYMRYDYATNSTYGSSIKVDINQTVIGNVSVIANNSGTELHAVWSGKNASYQNSMNIRYSKGTINADGSVTWSTVEQVTKINVATYYNFNSPYIVLDKDETPCIFTGVDGLNYYGAGESMGTTLKSLTVIRRDNKLLSGGYISTGWSALSLVNGTYVQSLPSAIFVPKIVNGLTNGRIWVTWQGKSATYTKFVIWYSYSDDNGVTWSAPIRVSFGNGYDDLNPSITVTKANEVNIYFNAWSTFTSRQEISTSKIPNGGSWNGETTGLSNAVQGEYPSLLVDFDIDITSGKPPMIYKGASRVGFYGTWTGKPIVSESNTASAIETRDLIDAIIAANRIGGTKKWAQGTVTTDMNGMITISGLSFKPRIVLSKQIANSWTYYALFDTDVSSTIGLRNDSNNIYFYAASLTVTDTGFSMYHYSGSMQVEWIAFE